MRVSDATNCGSDSEIACSYPSPRIIFKSFNLLKQSTAPLLCNEFDTNMQIRRD
ncbi:hypothetical protein TR2A62_1826 [Thalassobium sp. R2A62]|nr:hypothetical protein TR2A62_1826 [Thalassobium sp. R2A62]